jgi:hypothetical protein
MLHDACAGNRRGFSKPLPTDGGYSRAIGVVAVPSLAMPPTLGSIAIARIEPGRAVEIDKFP